MGEAGAGKHEATSAESPVTGSGSSGSAADTNEAALAHFNHGKALLAGGAIEEAVMSFRQATELQPKDPNCNYYLGQALAGCGRAAEAIAYFHIALELDPSLQGIHHNLGEALQKNQQFDEAFCCYLRSLQVAPDFVDTHCRLMNAVLTPCQRAEGIDCLQEVIRLNPEIPLPYITLGNFLTQAGSLEEACAHYRLAACKTAGASKLHLRGETAELQAMAGPHFLVAGAMRGGTTSLYHCLSSHPQVLPAIKKEVRFWDWHYACGLNWYLTHFPGIPKGSGAITGEATPCLASSEAWERVARHFPGMKLIVVLRNPVHRAVSHYHHMRQFSCWETRPLQDAMAAEMEDLRTFPDPSCAGAGFLTNTFGYVWAGLYVCWLRHWLRSFPREQFLFLKSEDLFADPARCMSSVFSFLGLPQEPEITFMHLCEQRYEPIAGALQTRLEDFFRPYNEELAACVDRQLSW